MNSQTFLDIILICNAVLVKSAVYVDPDSVKTKNKYVSILNQPATQLWVLRRGSAVIFSGSHPIEALNQVGLHRRDRPTKFDTRSWHQDFIVNPVPGRQP